MLLMYVTDWARCARRPLPCSLVAPLWRNQGLASVVVALGFPQQFYMPHCVVCGLAYVRYMIANIFICSCINIPKDKQHHPSEVNPPWASESPCRHASKGKGQGGGCQGKGQDSRCRQGQSSGQGLGHGRRSRAIGRAPAPRAARLREDGCPAAGPAGLPPKAKAKGAAAKAKAKAAGAGKAKARAKGLGMGGEAVP